MDYIRTFVNKIVYKQGLLGRGSPGSLQSKLNEIIQRITSRGIWAMDANQEKMEIDTLDFAGFSTLTDDFLRMLSTETGFDQYRIAGFGVPGHSEPFKAVVFSIQESTTKFLCQTYGYKEKDIAFEDTFLSDMDRARIAQMTAQAAAMNVTPTDTSKIELSFDKAISFESYKYFLSISLENGLHITMAYGMDFPAHVVKELANLPWRDIIPSILEGTLNYFYRGPENQIPLVYLIPSLKPTSNRWFKIFEDLYCLTDFSWPSSYIPHCTVKYVNDLKEVAESFANFPINQQFIPRAVSLKINNVIEWEVSLTD